MTDQRLIALAERWENEAEDAARRAIFGTSSGGATGTGGAKVIVAMFAVAAALRAQAERKQP